MSEPSDPLSPSEPLSQPAALCTHAGPRSPLAFHITRIRANRSKPGLRPQHLAAVRAAAAISRAQVQGADPGSTSLQFRPGRVQPGAYQFDI
ncbi:MAG: hypothetical protein GY719_22780, partial [bacterium]|nr:hypothetical protein [bacterium]